MSRKKYAVECRSTVTQRNIMTTWLGKWHKNYVVLALTQILLRYFSHEKWVKTTRNTFSGKVTSLPRFYALDWCFALSGCLRLRFLRTFARYWQLDANWPCQREDRVDRAGLCAARANAAKACRCSYVFVRECSELHLSNECNAQLTIISIHVQVLLYYSVEISRR